MRQAKENSGVVVRSGGAEGAGRKSLEDFERIYQAYSPRIYSLCLRMTGNTSEAEDLTQEAFLQMYRKLDTFRGDSAFYTWLHRLAVNVVLMRLRRLRSRNEMFLEELSPADEDDGTTYPVEIPVADLALKGALDRLSLEPAIAQLPPGFRAVFVLHDIEGYSHEEICALLGWAQGTSKSQLHRARLRLRALLGRGGTRSGEVSESVRPRIGRVAEAAAALAT